MRAGMVRGVRSRERILDATLALIESGGFAAVNVSAVASASGVSRQTIYSIFGTREELVSQAVAKVAMDALAGVQERLARVETALEYLVELIVAGRHATRDLPAMTALLSSELGNPLFDAGMMARALPVARALLADLPEPVADLDDVLEVVTRLGLTIVLFDSAALEDDDDLRRFLRRWLAPAVAPET